ncbi:MAG: SusC/RagA family TonB-linked outer membrane protein [Paludibacteraceae bacterium]|nr:SusC/RagA family TonB-linked outer membrane protein [Paludibacteraceae bacterium]
MKKLFFVLTCSLMSVAMMASITVRGVVISTEDGLPVIGASILEKGTSNGTITDFDGMYELTVQDGAVLVVSYVGMTSQELPVTGPQMDVRLSSDAIAMEEVVVTAMGVVQEKKRLNFAVQNIGGDALTENKSANFVNSLQGKIAGVSVTNSGGSPNSGSQIIIRGISSVNNSQSNEPLFILDGVAISGGASAAADINPNDIENITVLKGAAAAALYGQDAANGVIMITTKQGEAGKIKVQANGSWQWDEPVGLMEIQDTYMPGSQGFYKDKTSGGWGPLLNEGQQIYDNVGNFLKTGFYHKYDFSVNGGTEKFQAYASANYSKSEGIIPEDYKTRFGALVKASFSPAKWVTFNMNINVSDTKSRSTSGVSSAYSWPITDDITDYQREDGYPRFRYLPDVEKYNAPVSPLYGIYNDGGVAKATRNVINGSITLKPIKNLQIVGRVSYDIKSTTSESYTVPRWDDTYVRPTITKPTSPTVPTAPDSEKNKCPNCGTTHTCPTCQANYDKALADYKSQYSQYLKDSVSYEDYTDWLINEYPYNYILTSDDIKNMSHSSLGAISASTGRSQLFTAGFNASYKIELPKDFSIDVMAGGELKMSEGFSTSVYGCDFIIPGTYSLSNTNRDYMELSDRTLGHSGRRRFGYFGEIRGDYKGLASLSVTGRWDWSSTINNNPFFYPSVTGGIILSELIPGLNETKNNWFSYWKLRGNYAVVGKDAPAYLYDRRFKQFGTYPDGGYGIDPTMSSASMDLAPEMSYSWEIGMDIKFFDNKTRLDVAYYNTKVDNQIVTVRVSPSSGYILQTRNEGVITNQGVEFTLDQDIIKRKNFNWTMGLNFGLNRGTVVGLPEDVHEITGPQYGDVFTSAYLGGSTTALTGKDYQRNAEGQVIVDENGYPKINPNKNELIGNREAKFQAGLNSSMNIYGVQFSFLFDGRLGGDVLNVTARNMISNGNSSMLEKYRGRQVVFEGVTEHTDDAGNVYYEQNTKPITLDYTTIINYFYNVSTNFVEDGSYIRLSYVTLGYDFAKLMKNQTALKALKLNFTCNNVFLLTKYTGSDPVCNASTGQGGTGSAGIDNTPIPNTRSYNLSLTASF